MRPTSVAVTLLAVMHLVGCAQLFQIGSAVERRDAGTRPYDGSVALPDVDGAMVWTGSFDAIALPSGSADVRLSLVLGAAGTARGTLVLGASAAPAPPSDANVGWPPDATRFGSMIEGYVYPLDATIVGGTIDAVVDLDAPWDPWCRLQYPVPADLAATAYGCLPNTGRASTDGDCSYEDLHGTWWGVDCGRLALCAPAGGACSCTASECFARRGMRLDVHVVDAGSTATGLVGGERVHLTRLQ